MLPDSLEILSLKEIGCQEELPEKQDTLPGNALEKALYVWNKYETACFADDTGVEVDVLGGEPGVYSARYAGPQRDSQDNMSLLLDKLKDHENRDARFKTCIALVTEEGSKTFEGTAEGRITNEPCGSEGFGYDPVFVPTGYRVTFAEMSAAEKNKISHRAKAFEKLVEYLKSQA